MALKEFLSSTNDALSDRSSPKRIHIVLGNESCDLDSAVSAITFAFFLRSTSTDDNTYFLPILNIPRAQYRLKLEHGFFLGKFDLEPDLLTFIDDFNLQELATMEGVTLVMTLVDHHVVKDSQMFLKDKVCEVLDHRPRAEELPESWEVEIEKVGSCCTLVARRMLDHPSFPLDPIIVQLLIGCILVDTGNLSVSDGIATDTDHAVVMSLNSMLPEDTSPRQIFEDIVKVKFDLSSLTVIEMMYKDLKVLKGSYIVVAMSTITMDLEEVLSRPDFSHDASAFSAALPADATIIMTAVMGVECIASRCIAVYSASRVYRDQLTEVLLSSTSPNLGLQMMELPVRVEHVNAFVQTNLKASRKSVLPLIRDFLAGESTLSPDDENRNALLMAISSESAENLDQVMDEGNMQMRRHINLAKTALCDQFRTSMDKFDLAAVGTDAVISPSLSSDSELNVKSIEESLDDESRSSELESREVETAIERVPRGSSETTSPTSLLSSLMAKEDDEARQHTSPTIDPLPSNSQNEHIEPASSINRTENSTGPMNDAEDVLGMHSPFEFLCQATDSPVELLSLPASGQISGQESGQGSKVPSYPETPPNSYVMSPVGPGFFKQTQLPSFNSKEMVEKIQQKKRALSNRRRRGTDEDGDDLDITASNKSDGLDFFNVLAVNEGGLDSCGSGGGRSRGGGSLISPAVPQNSYVDLLGPFGQSPSYDIPALARTDIEEKVIEKRSQFDWDGGVPYTPQNSYSEGGAGTLAIGSLTSFNSAEMVARIRAKQAAMFGGSARASGSSDDSIGCHSPDGIQKSRGISLESPAQAYTPQNSYKDGLGILDGRGRLPDLNEVAERLSIEKISPGKGNRRSASNSGGESRDEDGPGPGGGGLQKPGGRHSSSQSDSQNTMSDVESLMSVSTDVGTPCDNIVASSIAGVMRADMMSLSRKDTGDSEVFTPGKPDDKPRVAFGFLSTDVANDGNDLDRGNHEINQNGGLGIGSSAFPAQSGELFSPLDDRNMIEEEVQYFQAAENIVAKSIAAAMGVNQDQLPLENGDISMSCLSLTKPLNSSNSSSGDGSRSENDELKSVQNLLNSIAGPKLDNDVSSCPAPTTSSDLSNLSTEISSLSQEMSVKKRTEPEKAQPQKHKSSLKTNSTKGLNGGECGVSFADREMPEHDNKIAEAALSELAYEWAHELIQGVLEDFNLSQDGLEQQSPRANGFEEGVSENGSEELEPRAQLCNYNDNSERQNMGNSSSSEKSKEGAFDWRKAGKEGMMADLSIVITTGDDGPSGQEENGSDVDEDMDGFSIEALDGSVGDFVRDDTVEVDEDEECLDKEEEEEEENRDKNMEMRENRSSIPIVDDHSPLGKPKIDVFQAERKLSRGSSSSTDSHNSERKWSRDTDKSLTILEDEMLTNFPEWKSMPEDQSLAGDEEEPITTFPGRKISLSEDYPRRFSRDEDLSRRSSKIDGDELSSDNLARPDDLETDYLPNMDPFQGNLDIISNESSFSKMTDVDREVVEGESFRRVSGHELESKMDVGSDEASKLREKESKHTADKVEAVAEDYVAEVINSLNQKEITEKETEKIIEKKISFQEQSLPSQHSPTVHKKKSIRVSFSEEVMEENGNSHHLLSRSSLRSPPPLSEYDKNPLSLNLNTKEGDDEDQSNAQGSAFYQHGKEIYFTTAGRISIAGEEEDCAFQTNSREHTPSVTEDLAFRQERAEVGALMASIDKTVRQAEDTIMNPNNDSSPHPPSSAAKVDTPFCTDPFTPEPNQSVNPTGAPDHSGTQNPFIPNPPTSTGASLPTISIPISTDLHPLHGHSRQASATSMGSVKGAEYQDEWQDDNIQDVAHQAGVDTGMSSDNVRRKIHADANLVPGLGEDDGEEDEDDEEDDNDHDSDIGDLEWENDTPIHPPVDSGATSAMSGAQGESQAEPQQRFKTVVASGSMFNIDMELVAPYKSVLSHGGYFDEGLSAVIVFYGFNLPSRRQEDYSILMNHLFHYVIHTLEELVADDYVIVYFHGSTPRRKMPGLGWLKRCYQCIDRRLKKNLKGMFLVHPTLWLRTVVTMTRPFISTKFSSKLKFVRDLDELHRLVPMENVTIPNAILQLEEILKTNPHYLEEQEELERKQEKEEVKEKKKKEKEERMKDKRRAREEKQRQKMESKNKKKERTGKETAG